MHKIVTITESQFKRLFLSEEEDPILDGSDTVKSLGSDAATSPDGALISGEDGSDVFGNPVDTDKFARTRSNQEFATHGSRRF